MKSSTTKMRPKTGPEIGRKTGKTSAKAAKPQPRPPVDARGALLREAKRVFAAKGFDGATVKDLADAAGVNISLVSYHFGGKEGLYRTCLESFGGERVETTERLLKSPTSAEDFKLRLRLFAEDFIEINQRTPDTCKMISRGLDNLDPVTSEVFKNVFMRVFRALHHFIQAAQNKGLIAEDADCEITATLMFGSLMHTVRSQELARILNLRTLDKPSYRNAVIDQWVDHFTQGLFQRSAEP